MLDAWRASKKEGPAVRRMTDARARARLGSVTAKRSAYPIHHVGQKEDGPASTHTVRVLFGRICEYRANVSYTKWYTLGNTNMNLLREGGTLIGILIRYSFFHPALDPFYREEKSYS